MYSGHKFGGVPIEDLSREDLITACIALSDAFEHVAREMRDMMVVLVKDNPTPEAVKCLNDLNELTKDKAA